MHLDAIIMDTPICKTCTHFHPHYTVNEQYCVAIDCGHCCVPRIKHRRPNQQACQHYTSQSQSPALPNRQKVIHFLTTEFLQYILNLELPPEMK